jgi:DNA mismatch repair protein MutS
MPFCSKETLKDLGILNAHGDIQLESLMAYCSTSIGQQQVQKYLFNPPKGFDAVIQQQLAIKFWVENDSCWNNFITNGTIVMLEKFFETADGYSSKPSNYNFFRSAFFLKIFNRNELHFTQFSITQIVDFVKAMEAFYRSFSKIKQLPILIQNELTNIQNFIELPLCDELKKIDNSTNFKKISLLSYRSRRELKHEILQLIQVYAKLDAWHGLSKATINNKWVFPKIQTQSNVCLSAMGLFHPLLTKPMTYDVMFDPQQNFMLLTGANMSGKTTFMRSLGIASLLAHIGMGVPASEFSISILDGIITNMHVEDDILKGESFFLAEVKSVKRTVETITQQNGNMLILMDELFKGTNVHDAYECTKAIVNGLLNFKSNIMVLSTHIHELAISFASNKQLGFYKFSTQLNTDGNFIFNYKIEPGISEEKIGYRILEKEGVIQLLNSKQQTNA